MLVKQAPGVDSAQRTALRVRVPYDMASIDQAAPAIPPLLKDLNERTVLETIRSGAPISRAEISRRARISKPTVSIALRSLQNASLVREVDHDPGGRRYGATFFEPVAEAEGTMLAARIDRAIRDELLFRAEVRPVAPGSLPRYEMKARRVFRT